MERGMPSIDPDYDLVIDSFTAICSRFEEVGFSGLGESERILFFAWQFVCEVNNGGIHQFFVNPSGEFSYETLWALEKAPMPLAAALLRRALAAFPDPAKVHDLRAQQVRQLPPCVQFELFDELTGAFYDSSEDPYRSLAEFVRQHQCELPR
jgi:hypothetical protein